MRLPCLLAAALLCPVVLFGQSPANTASADPVMLMFERFADIFGSRLVTAFDSIPRDKFDYRPTPKQQSVGLIAQHLESANYGLCERFGDFKHSRAANDALPDTVKAHWPKDTLVARLEKSLRFCDTAIARAGHLDTAMLASLLLAFETDLAEHYSQLSSYMRLLGLTPPSALPPPQRTAISLPPSALARYVGTYEISPGWAFKVTMNHDALFGQSTLGGEPVRLLPESDGIFFAEGVDGQVTFTRDPSGRVTGIVVHQFGRDRAARKVQ